MQYMSRVSGRAVLTILMMEVIVEVYGGRYIVYLNNLVVNRGGSGLRYYS